ncbi:MAG: patatin-like phospholipase RssA [Deltaproteobacteria bacterium]|nr:patatin-like phospholipase RssA [Deltaproteobacteria bacterium]
MDTSKKPTVGFALGGGSSRGWAHIGIIHALSEIGIEADIVCGCSIGSIVGASYLAGNLDSLEQWVCSLTQIEVAKFFELNLSLQGFVDIERLQTFFTKYICRENTQFKDLSKTFATVSTDLETGREIWFTEGPVLNSVWASISLPGLFPPIQNQGRWLVDGGLVNPVPVSVCRALGADIVIAVNLNGDIVGKHFITKNQTKEDKSDNVFSTLKKSMRSYSDLFFEKIKEKDSPPSLLDAITSSINITQDRITRSRMAGDPPNILLSPKLAHIGLLEFYRAKEAIQEGKNCVKRMLPEIQYIMDLT